MMQGAEMIMTRESMLNILSQVSFNVLWPDDSWEDLDFTESPIWINNKGYGYYACDEPNVYYRVSRIPDDKWKQIRQKLTEGTLSSDDLKGTSLANTYFSEWLDEPGACERFSSLLELPERLENDFYCAEIYADEVGAFLTTEKLAVALSEVMMIMPSDGKNSPMICLVYGWEENKRRDYGGKFDFLRLCDERF